MTMVQYIGKRGRRAFAVLEIGEYERLVAAAEEAQDERIAAADAANPAEIIPHEVVRRTAAGDNPVRVWREFRGLTQARLAAKAGMSQADISRLERGEQGARATTLCALAEALGVRIDSLV